MSLALDEPKDSDEVYDHNGVKYIIDETLKKRIGEVTIDFIDIGWRSGFSVTSERPIVGGACSINGGCSPTDGSCSC